MEREPHFFKVILDVSIREGKLEIPKKFIRKHGKDLPSPVILKVPNGTVWRVDLFKCDGEVWLENGWQEFAKHHSLDHGYFLVFKYEGHGHFCVFILDKSASEIQYPCKGICTVDQNREPVDENNEDDDVSVEIIDDLSRRRKAWETKTSDLLFCSSTACLSNHATSCTSIKVESSRCSKREYGGKLKRLTISKKEAGRQGKWSNSKALDDANKFSSSYPFFKAVVCVDNVKRSIVILPPAFVMQLNGTIMKDATLKDHNGKLWDVQIEKTEKDLIIKKGWQEFASHHSLVDADFLVFKYDGNSQFRVKLYGKNGLKIENALPNKVSSTHMDESETEEEKNRSHSASGCKRKYSAIASRKNEHGRSGGSRYKLRQAAGSSGGSQSKLSKTAGSSGGHQSELRQAAQGRQYKLRNAEGSYGGSESKLRQPTGSSSTGRRNELRQNTVTRNGECKIDRAYVTPENPHFATIVTRSTKYNVHIHKSVVKTHNLKLQENMTLCDENGQLWPVKVIVRDGGRICISKGWFNFRVKHKLAMQDMCVFEFIPTEDNICNVIHVQIIRRNGEFDMRRAQPN